MVNVQLIMLFPFLAYLFFFLDAEEVVNIIKDNGLAAVQKAVKSHAAGAANEKNQVSNCSYALFTNCSLKQLFQLST